MRVAVVVGLLVGCHSNHPATNDAPGGGGSDAAIASDAPAPRGTMTATVYGEGVFQPQGMPLAGVFVYFVEPDQTSTEIITGSDGVATMQAPDNTAVWIIRRRGSTNYD